MMNTPSRCFLLAAFSWVCLSHTATAFAPLVAQTRHPGHTQTFLTTQQASDLVQASKAAYERRDEAGEDVVADEYDYSCPKQAAAAAACPKQRQRFYRSFVSRVFSLPASLMHPHPRAETAVGEDYEFVAHDCSRNRVEDVVYFPIVGFTYVRDAPAHSRPLPSISNAACRLLPNVHEDVFGWFHPQ